MQRNRISRIRTAGRSVPVSLSVLGHGSLSVSDLDRNRPDGNRDFFLLEIDFLFTFICSTQLCELSIILWFLYNFNNLFQGEVED